jgi:hypothetical protein
MFIEDDELQKYSQLKNYLIKGLQFFSFSALALNTERKIEKTVSECR